MKIFSIEITNLKYKDLLNQITKFEKQNIVFTPNPEILLKIKTDKKYFKTSKFFNFWLNWTLYSLSNPWQ